MRQRLLAFFAVAAASAAVLLGVQSGAPAAAQGRPCGPPSMTTGTGTLGSPFTLKSMYDDDGPGGIVVVGEEFEINTQAAGQVWTVTFTYNGTVFFNADSTSTAAGIREVHPTPYKGGTSHMTAHAVSKVTGEVVDGFVDLPVAPARCGGH